MADRVRVAFPTSDRPLTPPARFVVLHEVAVGHLHFEVQDHLSLPLKQSECSTNHQLFMLIRLKQEQA